MEILHAASAIQRRFRYFERLVALDRRGMHLIDPWPLGEALGMTRAETERVVASLVDIGWIGRAEREGETRIALTVTGLARR
jgi:hypothetical protein